MKLTKESIKKSLTTRKKIPMNKSVENIKMTDYSTIQEEEDSTLFQIALDEYKDLFPEILLLSKTDFFSSLERYILIGLSTSDKIFSKDSINKVLYLIEKRYYNIEEEKIEKILKKDNFSNNYIKYTDNNFIPHCKDTKQAIHSCGEKLYLLLSEYYYCMKCNLIYKSDYIQLKCDKCNIIYYTEIENKKNKTEKKGYLKPATWAKYHCNALINDTMKCPKCQNCLYLNIKNNLLFCLKCHIQINQYDIKWKCILCNQLFFSEAKIFNKYEYKEMSLAIKKTLFDGIEAKPKYLPCCKVYGEKVKSYKYYHKNECNGLLYQGKLNNKKIVVCSKCHMLNNYENQYWLCPICKVRFQIQIKNNISLFDSSKIEEQNKNQQIYQDRETIGKKGIYKKRKKNNLSIELKKTIFNLCEKEKENIENGNEKDKDKDKERNSIIDSKNIKIFSTRNKPKKNIHYNNNYYNNFVNININDYSNIIYSNYKRNDNYKNEIGSRFRTIQDNKENSKENSKEKEKKINFNMTNYKNDGGNNFISIFKRNNSKILNGLSRNITSNVKSTGNIYPPQLLKSALSPNPNNSEIKSNYSIFVKNKQPTIFKHHRTKYSFDQKAIPTCGNNNNSNNNKVYNNNSKKIIGFNRVLSQKEIKDKIISEMDIMNEKNDLSNIGINLFKNRIPASKNKRTRISFEEKPSLLNNTNANINNKIIFNLKKDNINNNIQNEENKKEKEIKIILKEKSTIFKKNIQNIQIENNREKGNEKGKDIKKCNISMQIKYSFNSDDFNILKLIGQGSFGKIFEVEDKYHRHFAMKKIIACSLKEVELIKSEYNILYGLTNLDINLIGIYGIETKQLDRTTYSINVLMELAICDWEKEIIKRNSKRNYYTENELVLILKKLVNTFSTLQKANVTHRDIKPQNILVCTGGVLKIADFGEAKKIINKNNDNTIKQTIRGTELYMSPILFNSLRNKTIYKYTKHNTYKSDVFSLGYCMLLASTLSYKLLCEIREIKNMNGIKNIIQKYAKKGICIYSENYWNILYSMLELDEKNRPDFIELAKRIEDL